MAITTNAQKHADLELKVSQPENNYEVPFGDTMEVKLTIINHGPDDIIGDTLLIQNNVFPVSALIVDTILVGDSIIRRDVTMYNTSGDGEIADEVIDICYQFNYMAFNNIIL